MNKILVEVSIGELLDKISILEIKLDKIKDSENLKFISNEHSILKKQLDNNVKSDDKLNSLYQSLKEITRLSRFHSYICVESYRTELEKANLLYWQVTCEAFNTPKEWEWLFKKNNYFDNFLDYNLSKIIQ